MVIKGAKTQLPKGMYLQKKKDICRNNEIWINNLPISKKKIVAMETEFQLRTLFEKRDSYNSHTKNIDYCTVQNVDLNTS